MNAESSSGLPPFAFIDNLPDSAGVRPFNDDAPVTVVERECNRYIPIYVQRSADELNALEGITPAQREAMLAGSLFGWNCPAAQPDRYDSAGNFIRSA